MVAEATIDCYDEEEQLTGLATMIESNLEVPFTTTVLGLAVTVTGVMHASHGLVADCVQGVWGCVGRWFSGQWRNPPALGYIAQVKEYLREKIWLKPNFHW